MLGISEQYQHAVGLTTEYVAFCFLLSVLSLKRAPGSVGRSGKTFETTRLIQDSFLSIKGIRFNFLYHQEYKRKCHMQSVIYFSHCCSYYSCWNYHPLTLFYRFYIGNWNIQYWYAFSGLSLKYQISEKNIYPRVVKLEVPIFLDVCMEK